MSKVICDVCGTSYPSSAESCPICGCVRPADSAPVSSEHEPVRVERPEGYTYVKGGRFSKANVQKRSQGIADERIEIPAGKEKSTGNIKNDKGLVIAVCALLLAIVAVIIYIVVNLSGQTDDGGAYKPKPTEDLSDYVTQETTTEQTEEPVEEVAIALDEAEIFLNAVGAVHQIQFTLTPADVEDTVVFTCENEEIATVSDAGVVTAVASGETVITVACGTASTQCIVICDFTGGDETPAATTPPATNTPPATTTPVTNETYKAPFRINKKDVMIRVGEKFTLKLIDANKKIIPVTWTATDLETCTIEGNTITGAAKGTTVVSVVYEGVTYSCIVRVI